jgi:hypothetical protein
MSEEYWESLKREIRPEFDLWAHVCTPSCFDGDCRHSFGERAVRAGESVLSFYPQSWWDGTRAEEWPEEIPG